MKTVAEFARELLALPDAETTPIVGYSDDYMQYHNLNKIYTPSYMSEDFWPVSMANPMNEKMIKVYVIE